MATSGQYTFDSNRNEIIKAALRKLRAISQYEEPTAEEMRDGAFALNALVKAWQSQGEHLFKYEEIIIFLESSKTKYSLSPNGDNACLIDDFIGTTASGSAASGATSIGVVSDSGIADGDYIGIELADGTSQWTTVDGAPAANLISLDDALTGSVNSGAAVYTYSTKIQKPMRLLNAWRRVGLNDLQVNIISRDQYFDLPNKTSTGDPSQVHYNPKINQGNLFLWPSPSSVTTQLRATIQYPIEIFSAGVDTADFPSEWTRAMIFNLAVDLMPDFGNIDSTEFEKIKMMADEYLQDALDYDVEFTEVQLYPATSENESFGR